MTSENGIWNRVTESLRSKLSGAEIDTWFSRTTLDRLDDNNIAIIEVPNKFVANWLRDNYLKEIKNSFKSILNETPDIQFKTIKKYHTNFTHESYKKKLDGSFKHNLNRSMTFSNFVAGDNNRFAFSSAVEIARKPGDHYNPVFYFSKSSIGKTHLLHAMGNHIYDNNPYIRVKYIYSKKMISYFHYFLRNKQAGSFSGQFENIDILLFDDIHFLANRTRLQEEFVSIFNHMYSQKKQIVITGDHPPNQLMNMGAQLKSRLGWGLIVEIKPVDYQTKINIINNKIKEYKINISNDIISFLAKSDSDLKKLIKNIVRLETYLSLNHGNMNLSLVQAVIKGRERTEFGVKEIQTITSGYFDISLSDLISDKKKKLYSYPRHIAMYLCRKYTKLSLQEIGHKFGGRDHSTVIYAARKINRSKGKRKEVRKDLNNIENLLT